MWNEEVWSEHTPVEQKQHKKHENDHWKLLFVKLMSFFCWNHERLSLGIFTRVLFTFYSKS